MSKSKSFSSKRMTTSVNLDTNLFEKCKQLDFVHAMSRSDVINVALYWFFKNYTNKEIIKLINGFNAKSKRDSIRDANRMVQEYENSKTNSD